MCDEKVSWPVYVMHEKDDCHARNCGEEKGLVHNGQ